MLTCFRVTVAYCFILICLFDRAAIRTILWLLLHLLELLRGALNYLLTILDIVCDLLERML